jgi:hypothetical protein
MIGQIRQLLLTATALMASFAIQAAAPASGGGLPPFIAPLPADAAPPTSDPHDFRGMWLNYRRTPEQILTAEGEIPPFTPGASAAHDARVQSAVAGHPQVNSAVMCRPPGFLWVMGLYFPVRIMQDDATITFAFERFHTIWRIEMAEKSQRHLAGTYMGQSAGHWDGNTLVVETTGLKTEQWLDDLGTVMSDKTRLITHLTKRSGGRELEVVTEIDDPANYTKTWVVKQILNWRPDYLVLSEHDCEETAGQPEDAKKYGYSVPQ